MNDKFYSDYGIECTLEEIHGLIRHEVNPTLYVNEIGELKDSKETLIVRFHKFTNKLTEFLFSYFE